MLTLKRIFVSSIYGGELPARLAKIHPALEGSFYTIVQETKKAGGKVILSDMFRSWQMQEALRKRKPLLAAKAGTSDHEWGGAFDFDTAHIGIPRKKFYALCAKHGWKKHPFEAWHIGYPYKKLGYKTRKQAIIDVGNWKA